MVWYHSGYEIVSWVSSKVDAHTHMHQKIHESILLGLRTVVRIAALEHGMHVDSPLRVGLINRTVGVESALTGMLCQNHQAYRKHSSAEAQERP